MTGGTSFRRYRAGFFFVVALLAGVAGFTLFSELRTNARVDELVTQALERDGLIGRIRVDAALLENAVDDHIQAADDDARQAADARMEETLADAKEARVEYTKDLPEGEQEVWRRFDETARRLAQAAREAQRFSNRRQQERARQHLEAELQPVTAKLDELAAEVSQKNAEETRLLLHQREALRSNTTLVGALVAAAAVVMALLVGTSMVRILRRQESTIRAQLAELDLRNQELDAFASRVAHDLVSPLSPLKGYLTLIRRSPSVADPDVREMLALAESSAGRMAEIVESLLRFCRAGTPSEGLESDLDTAVTAILLEVDQVAARERVLLERMLGPRIRVAVPAQLVQSIAQNLLSNAVKYTAGATGARVAVRVAAEGTQAVLEVSDNGPGMSEETQRRLFQPFFRAAEARNLPGHGLGLATTKRLVEAHGGSIAIRSIRGAGTTATVRFPRVASDAPGPLLAPVLGAVAERATR